jgi:hypothetical protein
MLETTTKDSTAEQVTVGARLSELDRIGTVLLLLDRCTVFRGEYC